MKGLGVLAALLALVAAVSQCPRDVVRADGVVLSIANDRRAIVIRRDDLAGTQRIALPFSLRDPAQIADLDAGTAVRFVYSQRVGNFWRRLDEISPITAAPRTHDHRPQHGGVVEMIDRLHVEAAAERGGRVRLWLTDYWRRPLPLDDTSGELSITTDGRRQTIPLVRGADTLEATASPFVGPRVELHAALVHQGAPLSVHFIVSLDPQTRGTAGRVTRRCRTLAPGDTRPRCVVRFQSAIASVATAGNGDAAIIASINGQMGMWRPSTGELVTGLAPAPPADDGVAGTHGHDPPVATVSSDGRTAFVSVEDAVQRYDLRDGSLGRAMPLKGGHVQALAAAPDGRSVLVASRYGASAWLYDFESNHLLRTIPASHEVTAATFSADGRIVAIGDESGNVTVASTQDNSQRTFVGLDQPARGVATTDTDVIALSRDGTLAVWAREAGTARLRIPTEVQGGRLAVSGSLRIAAVAGEQQVQLYALDDGRLLDTILVPHGRITGMALGGNTLLLTDARGRMTIRDLGER